jgi:hypothetical protein
VYHDTPTAYSLSFYRLYHKEAYWALISGIASWRPADGFSDKAQLHLSRLVVDDLHAIGHFSCKLDKVLVRWVLVNIIVSVLCALKLDNEAMCIGVL